MVIDASTTAPTKGTIVTDSALFARFGDSAHIRYDYEQSTGGASGTGTYLFKLPSGLEADLTKITANTLQNPIGVVGPASSGTAAGPAPGHCNLYDSTSIVLQTGSAVITPQHVDSAHDPLGTANQKYSFFAVVPILGWKVHY